MKIRLALYAAVALLIAYLVWRDHSLTRKLSQVRAELLVSEASLETERKAREHEITIARKASHDFQKTVTSLQDELAARPLKPVVIRVPVRSSVPETASAGTSTGSNVGAEGREHGETEVDIAAELTAYSMDCQRNTSQLEALQGWIRAR